MNPRSAAEAATSVELPAYNAPPNKKGEAHIGQRPAGRKDLITPTSKSPLSFSLQHVTFKPATLSEFRPALTRARRDVQARGRLGRLPQETVILGRRQGNRVIYLAVIEGPQTIRYSARAGDLKPLHSSSIGKALLSALGPVDRKKTVAKLRLEKITDRTLTDQFTLLEDLKRAAARGYSETRGEHVADVMAIAKSIWLGENQFAVAVAGPLYRMEGGSENHVKELLRACAEIEMHPQT